MLQKCSNPHIQNTAQSRNLRLCISPWFLMEFIPLNIWNKKKTQNLNLYSQQIHFIEKLLIGYSSDISLIQDMYCAIIKDSSHLETHVILWSFVCFSLVNRKKNWISRINNSTNSTNTWDTPNENGLLFWPWLKSEMMTMMCWYDTFLSPYWIFMLHWNSDLQRASVGSHISLTRPAFSEHTLRNCYGNWLLWVIWHHHTLIW